MTVRVLLFAYLRELCGVREIEVTLPERSTASDAWATLGSRFERLPADPPRFAVNRVYVDKDHPLHDNDEIAFIPPVSGGN